MEKYIKGIYFLLRELSAEGTLAEEDKNRLLKSVKKLDHATKTGDVKRIKAAIDTICRTILR